MMTLSTVGYGDYVAKTEGEKVFAVIAMLFGALIFATITGLLASRMMTEKGAIQEYNMRMDGIRQFMRDKEVPGWITQRVVACEFATAFLGLPFVASKFLCAFHL